MARFAQQIILVIGATDRFIKMLSEIFKWLDVSKYNEAHCVLMRTTKVFANALDHLVARR